MSKEKHPKISIKLYRRLLWEVRSLWPLLVISIVGSVVYSACDSYSMYLLKGIINVGIIDKNAEYLKMISLLFIGLFFFRSLGSFLSSFYVNKMGQRIVLQFRTKVFSKMMSLPSSYYDKNSSGKLLSKLLYNVDQISGATGSVITSIFQDGSFAIFLLILLFVTSWKLSLIILVFAPILGILISWVTKQFRKLSWNSQNAMSEVTHTAEESMTSYKEIRIFGGQEQQSAKFYKHAYYTYSQQIKTNIIDCVSSPFIQFIGGIVVAIAIFIAAVYSPKTGWISAGSFVVFITSTLALLQPIKRLTSVNSTIQKAIAAAEGLYELLDQPDEIDNGTYTTEKAVGHYQLKGVEFKYNPTSELVLKGIDLEIQPGQTIAFVGSSGGGKTTIVNLLIRFYEATSGEILLDGVNINDYKLANLRDQIAMVSQHVSLFNDTLYNNIAFGKKGDTNVEAVTKAAEAAYAWRFIKDLPEGLNTLIGENGYGLSGGQRQRVAIARAILKDAPILILDEATSALDTESERFVQKALDELMVGKTTFVVAHRLSTIENADKIVVMDKGILAEQGTHDELLAKNGVYANLYNRAKSLNQDAIE